jgi:hypothetical protein
MYYTYRELKGRAGRDSPYKELRECDPHSTSYRILQYTTTLARFYVITPLKTSLEILSDP